MPTAMRPASSTPSKTPSKKAQQTPKKAQATPKKAPTRSPLDRIGGYMVVPVRTALAGSGTHPLYVRRHQSKSTADAPSPAAALFVTNLPALCSSSSLTLLFGPSHVTDVTFGVLGDAARDAERAATFLAPPASLASRALLGGLCDPAMAHRRADGAALRVRGAFAIVGMASEESVESVLQWGQEERTLVESEQDDISSISGGAVMRYLQSYESRRLDAADLLSRADLFMSSHDRRLDQERFAARARAAQPDDDGFTLVSRHRPTDAGVAIASKKALKKLEGKAKAASAGMNDFYRFQVRQAKRDQLAELRSKFEEDKQKVDRMRAARKFRPY